jgi:lysine 6-dehydrogenase
MAYKKVFCLGGAGKIAREAALDLVQSEQFEKITIGDNNDKAACEVAEWLNNSVVDWVKIDINNTAEAVKLMKPYDIVMDGTTISLNRQSAKCIAQAGCHGINLNGFGEEYEYKELFKSQVFIPLIWLKRKNKNHETKHSNPDYFAPLAVNRLFRLQQ